MGYKKIDQSLDFPDLALANSLKHNHSLKLMEKIGEHHKIGGLSGFSNLSIYLTYSSAPWATWPMFFKMPLRI